MSGWPLADRVVPLTYSAQRRQADRDMYEYKSRAPGQQASNDAWQRLSLLIAGFTLWHTDCLDAVSHHPVTTAVTVPSLRGRRGPHPLDELAAYLPRTWRPTALNAIRTSADHRERRALNPAHFKVVESAAVRRRHVVVVEDTWVTGGHAQSAAAALRLSGAAEVTVLPLARRLSATFQDNVSFLADQVDGGQEYTIDICPVTGDACP
ncbi:hypothetical protein [Streptomyces alboflavus]|uniref:hypothetical protein n=1 Tax=Streptomyces alboflavus TaxID=67267 RepID=UPI0004BFDE64|nr:hypothetical protein [Streptomyces alboflavus]